MTIDEFLHTFVEGYLFHDLKAMNAIPQKPNGGCSYPMVATVIAGMELLGGLLLPAEPVFSTRSGNEYFVVVYRLTELRQG